jgi:iron-sulfur cluster repair protein YtfE (RIC family)
VNATYQAPVVHQHHDRLRHHVDIMPATGDLIGEAQPAEISFALDQTCEFLTELLIPHMEAAERAIYPELERLFQNRHSMTPMRREHTEIRTKIADLTDLRDLAKKGALGISQQIRLRRTLFGLYALLKVHLAEELLYADLVEHGATPDQEAALATAMAHAGTSTS